MKDSSSKSLARTISRYAASRIYQQVLGIVTSFLCPKLLSANDFGIWTLLKVIPRYGYYTSHLGTGTSMRYLVPYYQEKGNPERAAQAERTTFSTGIGMNLITGILFVSIYLGSDMAREFRIGFLCMAIFLVLQFAHEYYLMYLKAHGRFDVITKTNYVFLTSGFLLTVPLLFWLRLYGLYVSIVLAEVVALIYLRGRLGRVLHFGWSWNVFRELLGKGMPLMLLNFSVDLIATIDRVVVSHFLGNAVLGSYGVAILAAGVLLNIPGAARDVMETQVMRSADSMAPKELAEEYGMKPLVQTAWQMPFLLGPSALLLPAAVTYLLPKYVSAIVPGQILICGMLFLALVYVTRMVIVARHWQLRSLAWIPWALGVNVGCGYLAVRWGYGLKGVAVTSSLSYLVLFVLISGFLARQFRGHGGAIFLRRLPVILAPFATGCALIWTGNWIAQRTLPYLWLQGMAGCVFFLGVYLALYMGVRSRLGLPGFEARAKVQKLFALKKAA